MKDSPQKDILFQRMEGTQPVIPKNYQFKGSSKDPKKNSIIAKKKHSVATLSEIEIHKPGFSLHKIKVKDKCWICEGWSECKFEFRSNIFGG